MIFTAVSLLKFCSIIDPDYTMVGTKNTVAAIVTPQQVREISTLEYVTSIHQVRDYEYVLSNKDREWINARVSEVVKCINTKR
jgi:hypothetical protein